MQQGTCIMPQASWAVSAATWRAMDNPRREETWERMTREERFVLLHDVRADPGHCCLHNVLDNLFTAAVFLFTVGTAPAVITRNAIT